VLPAQELATAFFALGDGVALQHMNDPDGVPDDLYVKMLTIFVAGLQASAADGEEDEAEAPPAPRKRSRK
jgi:hypothetical protein